MNKILVTGANGQLGNELRQLTEKYKNFNFLFTDVEELDITDLPAIDSFVETNKVDLIINAAAYTNVDKAEEDYDTALLINATAVGHLTKIATKYNIPLIHISTDYVFDGKNYIPYTEADKTNPLSAYGKTKLLGEKEALKHDKSLIIRTSWLYSSFGNNFVKTILRLSDKPEIKVVFDQIGTPTYAADLAFAILQIAKQILSNNDAKYGIYHYSNEGVCSWYDFAQMIIQLTQKSTKIIAVRSDMFPRPAPRPSYSVLDKAKIKQQFGIEIPFWLDSLKKCLQKLEIIK